MSDNRKKALVLWSGGLDSTGLICHYLSKGWLVDALPVRLKNTYGKNDREANARLKMFDAYFRAQGVKLLGESVIYNDGAGDMVFSQAPRWLNAAVAMVGVDHSEVALGYVMNDDAISYLDDFRRIWRAFGGLWPRGHQYPKLVFPFSKWQKIQILDIIPRQLHPMLTWCENPGEIDHCGMCRPCKKALSLGLPIFKEDLASTDDNDDVV